MRSARLLRFGLLALVCGCADVPAPEARSDLAGTAWQLVRFEGGDGTVLEPDAKSKYTVAFAGDGSMTVRIDCNRGSSSWTSAGPNQLQLGRLALTRAACPSPSLHDRVVKHWPYVRSYVIRDARLYLSLMADGGIYEFEPTSVSE